MSNFAEIAAQARNSGFVASASIFGLPNVISLLLIRRYVTDNVLRQEFRILRDLVWKRSPPDIFAPLTGTDAREDKFEILGIGRDLDCSDWLQETGTSYWVNAEVQNMQPLGGFEVEFVTIDETNPLVRNLTVRRKPDERKYQ